MRLEVVPLSVQDANHFVEEHHSHHGPTVSGLWATAVVAVCPASVPPEGMVNEEAELVGDFVEPRIVGVAIVGRPVARPLDDGWTVEVTRCCVAHSRTCDSRPQWGRGDDWLPTHIAGPCNCYAKHAASKLYGAARRQAVAMGYRQIVTYTLEGEPGTSLTAAGFTREALVRGRSWSTPSRPRVDKHPTLPKQRWAGL